MRRLIVLIVASWIVAPAVAGEDPAKPAPPSRDYPWISVAQWHQRHQHFLDRVKQGNIDLLFLGDSITQVWDTAAWQKYYAKRNAANFGSGGDMVQNVLWRITHGEIDGIAPKAIVLMIGTNNFGLHDDPPGDVARGIEAVVKTLREKLPNTHVLLLGILPRGEKPDTDYRQRIKTTNESIGKLADGRYVHCMDIGHRFLNEDGSISKEIMPDFLHLSPEGYEIWATAIEGKIKELMGER